MSLRDWLAFIAIMAVATAICWFLRRITTSDVHVPLVFVLAVLVVALCTNGYFYGVMASFLSVFFVNFAFTYPYLKLDFSVYGYPLTFFTMLAVGFAASTLTTRVKSQEALKIETEKEKIRANLLRAVSHDLRTPLTSISGSITAVLENGGSMSEGQNAELLQGAKKDAEWLCRMVENLLSITRINGSELHAIRKQPEAVEEVVGEAVMNFRKKNPGVEVSVTVPDEVLFVPMDAMLIEQVLLNLLDNAVRHGLTTTEIAVCAAPEKGHVTISVKDNGKGLSGDTLDRLFAAPMDRDGSADDGRSMGIGLLVCKTIVEAHGGRIYAGNAPEGGAVFTFELTTEDDGNAN